MTKDKRIQVIESIVKDRTNNYKALYGNISQKGLPIEKFIATAIEEAIGVDENRILKIIIKDILEFDYDTMTAKEYKEARIQFFKNRKDVAKEISTNKEVINIREIV